MYIQKIRLKNIRAFSELEINFIGSDGTVRKWTTIFGDNGSGKSTLLRAIAVALAGPGAMADLIVPTPKEWEWVCINQPYGEIYAEILQDGNDKAVKKNRVKPFLTQFIIPGPERQKLPKEFSDTYDGRAVPQEWSGVGDSKLQKKVTEDMNQLKKSAYAEDNRGWLACGYGAFRRLKGGGEIASSIVHQERKSARFVTLFHEAAALTNLEDWLIKLYNQSITKDGADSKKRLQIVQNVFERNFLPFGDDEQGSLLIDPIKGVRLVIGDNEPMPLDNLSDGFRSMLAMGMDLIRWITSAFPDSSDPLQETGVVLIDELDVHLHPKWQRRIGFWLREKFPNIQFIVTTHSPFPAQVSDEIDGNIVLENISGNIQKRESLEFVQTWRADQILTELLDLPTTRSPKTEKDFERFQKLSIRTNLSEKEQEELQRLQIWVENLSPSIEDVTERRQATLTRELVKRLRSSLENIE